MKKLSHADKMTEILLYGSLEIVYMTRVLEERAENDSFLNKQIMEGRRKFRFTFVPDPNNPIQRTIINETKCIGPLNMWCKNPFSIIDLVYDLLQTAKIHPSKLEELRNQN